MNCFGIGRCDRCGGGAAEFSSITQVQGIRFKFESSLVTQHAYCKARRKPSDWTVARQASKDRIEADKPPGRDQPSSAHPTAPAQTPHRLAARLSGPPACIAAATRPARRGAIGPSRARFGGLGRNRGQAVRHTAALISISEKPIAQADATCFFNRAPSIAPSCCKSWYSFSHAPRRPASADPEPFQHR